MICFITQQYTVTNFPQIDLGAFLSWVLQVAWHFFFGILSSIKTYFLNVQFISPPISKKMCLFQRAHLLEIMNRRFKHGEIFLSIEEPRKNALNVYLTLSSASQISLAGLRLNCFAPCHESVWSYWLDFPQKMWQERAERQWNVAMGGKEIVEMCDTDSRPRDWSARDISRIRVRNQSEEVLFGSKIVSFFSPNRTGRAQCSSLSRR